MTKTYDFKEQLAKSHMAEDMPFWKEIYKKAFPDMVTMISHRQDGEHQRAGIDRSIILHNSKQILIDEKVRYRSEKTGMVYEDIILEYWSNEEQRSPGWVIKPLRADYIAYAIEPLGICYLLPVIQLQQAWKKWGERWKAKYPKPIKARTRTSNGHYTTVSVAVEVKELFKAIGACLRIEFNPYEKQTAVEAVEDEMMAGIPDGIPDGTPHESAWAE